MALTSETGKEFRDADEALAYIRVCEDMMLNPNASLLESSAATVEMVYTFRALDSYLRQGGQLPVVWGTATH